MTIDKTELNRIGFDVFVAEYLKDGKCQVVDTKRNDSVGYIGLAKPKNRTAINTGLFFNSFKKKGTDIMRELVNSKQAIEVHYRSGQRVYFWK